MVWIKFLLLVHKHWYTYSILVPIVSVQYSSVTQSCPTLYDPMDGSVPGFPVHHQLPELAQTHVYWVHDAIQPFHLLLSPSPPAFNLSLEKEMATHSSFLAWEIPWTEEPGGLLSMGSQRVRHNWEKLTLLIFLSIRVFSNESVLTIRPIHYGTRTTNGRALQWRCVSPGISLSRYSSI